ncbi:MAG: PorT family protein [Tannerella sp.]|jgi:hypothetical protein|nr:PorT family protein [Tannerella sp.]
MKFKSILFSGALALLCPAFATAQSNVSIGVRGGLTIPGLTGGAGDPVSEGYSTATRMGAGVFAEIKISDVFSIQPMLEYTQEGAKRSGMQALVATASNAQLAGAFPAAWQGALSSEPQLAVLTPMLPANFPAPPQYLYADAKRDAKMDYLMLPVLAKFGWNLGESSPWRVYVSAGPYVALLLNAKNEVSMGGSSVYADNLKSPLIQLPNEVMSAIPEATGAVAQISDGLAANLASGFDGTEDIKDQLHPFNWGLEGNIGLQYQINRNKIFIEAGGNYGLMNIQKSTGNGLYLNGKNHIGAATVMIGYAYEL